MLLLKVINESMKKVSLNITWKARASFREQVDDFILSRYLVIYINKYSFLFFRVLLNLMLFKFLFSLFLIFFLGSPFLVFPPFLCHMYTEIPLIPRTQLFKRKAGKCLSLISLVGCLLDISTTYHCFIAMFSMFEEWPLNACVWVEDKGRRIRLLSSWCIPCGCVCIVLVALGAWCGYILGLS
jgi:hypothetical protein